MEEEMKTAGAAWGAVKKAAQNRVRWRVAAGALGSHQEAGQVKFPEKLRESVSSRYVTIPSHPPPPPPFFCF